MAVKPQVVGAEIEVPVRIEAQHAGRQTWGDDYDRDDHQQFDQSESVRVVHAVRLPCEAQYAAVPRSEAPPAGSSQESAVS